MNKQIPIEIRAYLTDILQQTGNLPEDQVKEEAMLQELYTRLDKFLSLKMVDFIPDEKLDSFSQMLESQASAEQIQQFVSENVPNAQDVFTVAFGEFRDMYTKGLTQIESSKAS